ncbi:hypothetical protein EYF80_041513 [Liparis tanakae]|uniref:Uncharacterized protein n=1 Tax=Liparis tanakae TaxID=230148 RepID=A0A4Z2G606_9TELE|nr:hypothetical protein EYF80_041513 [Liparis tanakae]
MSALSMVLKSFHSSRGGQMKTNSGCRNQTSLLQPKGIFVHVRRLQTRECTHMRAIVLKRLHPPRIPAEPSQVTAL